MATVNATEIPRDSCIIDGTSFILFLQISQRKGNPREKSPSCTTSFSYAMFLAQMICHQISNHCLLIQRVHEICIAATLEWRVKWCSLFGLKSGPDFYSRLGKSQNIKILSLPACLTNGRTVDVTDTHQLCFLPSFLPSVNLFVTHTCTCTHMRTHTRTHAHTHTILCAVR